MKSLKKHGKSMILVQTIENTTENQRFSAILYEIFEKKKHGKSMILDQIIENTMENQRFYINPLKQPC